MKKIKVLKKPGQGKIASKKDFKAKEVNIPDHEFHAKEKKKEDKEDKKFIPFAEYVKKKSS
jgi:hypothetical protein